MGQKKEKENFMFDYNAKEYAELLGISTNALRMRRRRGLLEGEYEFRNGQYNFRHPYLEHIQ